MSFLDKFIQAHLNATQPSDTLKTRYNNIYAEVANVFKTISRGMDDVLSGITDIDHLCRYRIKSNYMRGNIVEIASNIFLVDQGVRKAYVGEFPKHSPLFPWVGLYLGNLFDKLGLNYYYSKSLSNNWILVSKDKLDSNDLNILGYYAAGQEYPYWLSTANQTITDQEAMNVINEECRAWDQRQVTRNNFFPSLIQRCFDSPTYKIAFVINGPDNLNNPLFYIFVTEDCWNQRQYFIEPLRTALEAKLKNIDPSYSVSVEIM
ncbi:MAG: hypothetical protein RLZ12_581 [Bacillota bacterium]